MSEVAAAREQGTGNPPAADAERSTRAESEVEEILVLDFGGQYSQLIARRIRECGVFAELLPATASADSIRERRPKGLVLSGGPASVYEPGAPAFPTDLLELGIPMLGICYGMQAMVRDPRRQGRGGGVGGVRADRADPDR